MHLGGLSIQQRFLKEIKPLPVYDCVLFSYKRFERVVLDLSLSRHWSFVRESVSSHPVGIPLCFLDNSYTSGWEVADGYLVLSTVPVLK